MDETPQYPPSQIPPPDPLTARRPPITPATKMRDRANSWKNVFIALLILGLLGAVFIAVGASARTDFDGQTTYDAGTAIGAFGITAVSAILFSLPFLAFSQIINGQADLYES